MDEIHATGLRVFIPAYLLYFHFVDMSVLADELACIKKPAARTSLLMTAGSLQHHREIGPRSSRVLPYRRFGHDFNLGDRQCALTVGGAYTVAAGIAAADDKHMLVTRTDAVSFGDFLSGIDAVLLLEEFKGKVHALEIAAFDFEVTGYFAAYRHTYRIVVFEKLFGSDVLTGINACFKLDAFLSHESQTAVDDALVELEIGDAESEEASDGLVFLKDSDTVSALVELVGTCQS